LVIVVPPPVEDKARAGIVLMMFPGIVEVTLIDTVHDPGAEPVCAGTVPPLKEKDVAPTPAFTKPPQLFVMPTGSAMVRPGCTPFKASVHDAFVSGNGLGLKTETLRRDIPPDGMEIGEKLLLISAGKETV
jgi:hypothetical protein